MQEFQKSQLMASFLIIISVFVGSFIAVLTLRGPKGDGFLLGRSHCDACGKVLGARELMPVLSAVFLGWHCRYCGVGFAKRDTLIELGALGVAIWAVLGLPSDLRVVGVLLGWALLTLAIIDFENFILPDWIVLVVLIGGILVAFGWYPGRLSDIASGAGFGAGGMWGVRLIYQWLRGQEGLGLGDVKLMAAVGAWVGWQGLGSVILIAAIAGVLVHVAAHVSGRKASKEDMVPFGSYLSLATWIVWLHGPIIVA